VLRFTRRRAALVAVALVLLAAAAPNVWAWAKLRAGRAALAAHHPEDARRALSSCAAVWGARPSVRLLACRAAWQAGDPEAAVRELRAVQRRTGATADTALEWALAAASAGELGETEQFLQEQMDARPELAPLVWEALALGYLRVYRTRDAMTGLNFWLARDPDNVRALDLRGQTYVVGKGVVRGCEDYRRVLERDPARADTRRRLADGLIALGGYEEAATHLEVLRREAPTDAGLAARLARCYALLGRGDEARALLTPVLAAHPDDGPALRTLGQVELVARRADAAEAPLRRAAALLPNDYHAQQLFFQSLQQQNKLDEARVQLKVAEAVRERSERMGELTSRRLAENPLDPALHAEMGKLLIESGSPDVAEQWLLTALRLDPAHRAAHAALAGLYAARGDAPRADRHRALSGAKP
jgi:cellulose synthase operon protein C